MKMSLTKKLISSELIQNGVMSHTDGSLFKCFSAQPLSSGVLEENFYGSLSDNFFAKLSELLGRLPNFFDGQITFVRQKINNLDVALGFETKIYFFEKVQKNESYSHLKALLEELKFKPQELSENEWQKSLLSLRIWRFQREPDAFFQRFPAGPARKRRHLRHAQPARWSRIRRSLASGRHVTQKTERI